MERSRPILLCAVAALLMGCGYPKSGFWVDDPKNWRRAFRSEKPADVVVVHSTYWRSPHWSYEFEYFFEIVPTPELSRQLFGENDLKKVSGGEAERVLADSFNQPPTWFAPGAADRYEVWVYAEDYPGSHFTVAIDGESGHIFLHDYLV